MPLPPGQLSRARQGDRRALAAVVEHYQHRVFAVCTALAGADAEDCAQDALIKVLAGLPRFDPDATGSLAAWVMTITRRVCIDRARSARVTGRVDLALDDLAADAGPTADHARDALVREAVSALPDDQRAAVALRVWGELSYDEIAALEAVPIGTVRSRLARARDALRIRLAPLAVDPTAPTQELRDDAR
jgi:RNA polymerase sigma-70 factor (ECF subfamily)